MKALFMFATDPQNKPCVVVVDSIEQLSQATEDLRAEFLIQMQNLPDGVLVVACTSRPHDLDGAVRRRFQRRMYIPLPDLETRGFILK
jgi:vacuolar protein-sorting-associated protein 4